MSLPTDPQALAEAAQAFRKLDKKTLLSIQAKLLAKIAGYGDDPDIGALNAASVQFRNLPATAQNGVRLLLAQKNADPGWTVDLGNDPVLGPPFPPVAYELFAWRGGQGSFAPGISTTSPTQLAANATRLSWTVPTINLICTATYDGTPGHFTLHHPEAALLPAITNFFVYCKLSTDVSDPVLFNRGYHSILLTHNYDTSQRASGGATTAAQSGNIITLSGGSFTFTNTATDQGKFIEWGGIPFPPGVTIQAVTDATHAIVDYSQTHAAAAFSIWSPGPNIDDNDLTVPVQSPATPYTMSVWCQTTSVPRGSIVQLSSNLVSLTVNADNTITVNS